MPRAKDNLDAVGGMGRRKTRKANWSNGLDRQSGKPENQREKFKAAPEQAGAAVRQESPDVLAGAKLPVTALFRNTALFQSEFGRFHILRRRFAHEEQQGQ
jgi:hypothetical protein